MTDCVCTNCWNDREEEAEDCTGCGCGNAEAGDCAGEACCPPAYRNVEPPISESFVVNVGMAMDRGALRACVFLIFGTTVVTVCCR